MEADSQDLEAFSHECLKIGCLRGFKYFNCYLRGREELLVTVFGDGKSTAKSEPEEKEGEFRTFSVISRGHPPASPRAHEPKGFCSEEPNEFVFLVATYARYGRPLVWVRSRNKNVKFTTEDVKDWMNPDSQGSPSSSCGDEDLPLCLTSTEAWPRTPKTIHVWDVIAELVGLCVVPSPTNPFELTWGEGVLDGLGRDKSLLHLPKKQDGALSANTVQQLFATGALISQFQSMALPKFLHKEHERLCAAHFELLERFILAQRNSEHGLKPMHPLGST
eukprot:RCo044910